VTALRVFLRLKPVYNLIGHCKRLRTFAPEKQYLSSVNSNDCRMCPFINLQHYLPHTDMQNSLHLHMNVLNSLCTSDWRYGVFNLHDACRSTCVNIVQGSLSKFLSKSHSLFGDLSLKISVQCRRVLVKLPYLRSRNMTCDIFMQTNIQQCLFLRCIPVIASNFPVILIQASVYNWPSDASN